MKSISVFLQHMSLSLMLLVVCSVSWAGSYDIKEMTPTVKSALDARRTRFESLSAFKAQGKVGENNRGYVEVLNGATEAADVVSAENADRKTIYTAIVQQNQLPSDALATVEKVFAQVQRDKATSGDSIQDESGNWGTK